MEQPNEAWLTHMNGKVLYNLYSPLWGQLACSVRFHEKYQISSLLLQVPNNNTVPATVQIRGPNRQCCGLNRPIPCHSTQLHETNPMNVSFISISDYFRTKYAWALYQSPSVINYESMEKKLKQKNFLFYTAGRKKVDSHWPPWVINYESIEIKRMPSLPYYWEGEKIESRWHPLLPLWCFF